MMIELDCGCEYDAEHETGDRLYICTAHHRHYVIRSARTVHVTHTVKELAGMKGVA
jgi:hypothetical protein